MGTRFLPASSTTYTVLLSERDSALRHVSGGVLLGAENTRINTLEMKLLSIELVSIESGRS